uniref:Uncharacterized protein n=1 Tax=Anopheles quadriannulatus TaxID=34691 RepID=A0A182XSC8_ANOQN
MPLLSVVFHCYKTLTLLLQTASTTEHGSEALQQHRGTAFASPLPTLNHPPWGV